MLSVRRRPSSHSPANSSFLARASEEICMKIMNKQLSRTPTPNVAAIQREIKSGVGGSIAFQFKWICKASCCPTSELTAKHTERRRCKCPVTGVQCGLFFFLPSFPASSEGGRWMNSGVARATRRCKRPIRKCVNTGEKNDGTRLGEVTRVDRRVRPELKDAKMKAKKKKQESIHRPYLEVSAPHAAGANTSTGNTGQMHACMHCIKLSGSLFFRGISKHIPEYMHATHTSAAPPQQCLTREVIDFDAWYTGVKNEVKLTVGCRLGRKSQ